MDRALGDPLIVRHVLLQAAVGDPRRMGRLAKAGRMFWQRSNGSQAQDEELYLAIAEGFGWGPGSQRIEVRTVVRFRVRVRVRPSIRGVALTAGHTTHRAGRSCRSTARSGSRCFRRPSRPCTGWSSRCSRHRSCSPSSSRRTRSCCSSSTTCSCGTFSALHRARRRLLRHRRAVRGPRRPLPRLLLHQTVDAAALVRARHHSAGVVQRELWRQAKRKWTGDTCRPPPRDQGIVVRERRGAGRRIRQALVASSPIRSLPLGVHVNWVYLNYMRSKALLLS